MNPHTPHGVCSACYGDDPECLSCWGTGKGHGVDDRPALLHLIPVAARSAGVLPIRIPCAPQAPCRVCRHWKKTA